jgi:protein involved in polysaccharide export with SLBB domain
MKGSFGMMRTFVLLGVALTAAFAQTPSSPQPTPQQVQQAQQALQSGAVTPQMLDAARAQYPEIRGLSNEQIQQKLKEAPSDATGTPSKAPEPGETATAANDGTDPANAGGDSWNSEREGSGGDQGFARAGMRFPAGLARFGQEFFRNADAEGLGPNAPALPEYVLSPGDEIQIYTWGRDSRSQSVTIDNDGMFNYPPLSPMRLAGMRFGQAQDKITAEIQKIHGVTAAVSLGRLRSIRIMVLGEAVRPGSYALPAGVTVTGALFRSGGVSGIGSLRAIEVRRGGKTIATLDLYDMLLRGNSKGDIQLLPGDAIFIPLVGPQIAVHGKVKRPAIYEVKGSLRALDAVDLAGGLQSNAFKGRIRIERVQGNRRNIVLDVDMNNRGDLKSNVKLEDGDVLFIDRVLDRLDDVVTLTGNVNRPGNYQFKPGMTVRDLIPTLQDLKPETFFEYAHIRRPAPDDDRPILLNFSLADVFSKGTRVALQPRDEVKIYSRYDVIERPTVSISGTVRRPGTYAYNEAMSVSDLIILGGGLGDAFMQEAHLVRVLPGSGPGDSLYTELVRVNLARVLENPSGPDNLELRPFDQLKVLPRANFLPKSMVSVLGAVNGPGAFELSEGMGLPELINMGGGLSKNGYRLGVEVSRRKVVSDSILRREVIKLNLKDLLEGRATFTLQDGDAVYVREVINAHEQMSVILRGEFNFPGRYEIQPGERLSAVVRRAGGFTKEAYLRGAVFLRVSVKEQQLRHAEEVGRRLNGQLQARLQMTTLETEKAGIELAMARGQQLVGDIRSAPYLGRVVISLDRKLKFADTDWDLELENGDELTIGPTVSTVSVLGEVSSPTTLIHTRKTNQVGEVLAKAGGINAYGDYKETFYIAPDGAISTPRSTPWYSSFKCKEVEPGGTVIVPIRPPAKDYLEVWAKSTQILYQLAISVGVVATLF